MVHRVDFAETPRVVRLALALQQVSKHLLQFQQRAAVTILSSALPYTDIHQCTFHEKKLKCSFSYSLRNCQWTILTICSYVTTYVLPFYRSRCLYRRPGLLSHRTHHLEHSILTIFQRFTYPGPRSRSYEETRAQKLPRWPIVAESECELLETAKRKQHTIWNSLSDNVISAPSLSLSASKTFPFHSSFPNITIDPR